VRHGDRPLIRPMYCQLPSPVRAVLRLASARRPHEPPSVAERRRLG
jgi:hypothetical protein